MKFSLFILAALARGLLYTVAFVFAMSTMLLWGPPVLIFHWLRIKRAEFDRQQRQ